MSAFVLLGGYSRKPTDPGSGWEPLAIVNGNDPVEAAAKIGAAVAPHDQRKIEKKDRRFNAMVAKAVLDAKELRGKQRRTAMRRIKEKILRFDAFHLVAVGAIA